MKRMLIVPVVLLFLAGSAVASPLCADEVGLSAYVANYQGFANACSIGDKLFYDFTFDGNFGSQVQVLPDPGDGLTNPGLSFSSGFFAVDPGQSLDVTLTFKVATLSGSALMEDYSLSIAGGNYDTTSAGVGTVTESFSNPSGTSLLASFGPGAAHINSAHTEFTPFISGTTVTTHIQLSDPRGSSDIVEISDIQEHFSEQIPEPYETVLIGSGLLLLGLRRRRVKR